MAARRMAIIGLLLCLCLFLLPCSAFAASTADAAELISPDRECSLTLTYTAGGTVFGDMPVKVYQIGNVSAEAFYTLTTNFQSTGLVINGIQSADEWDMIRSTLEAHILANSIEPDYTAVTDQNGQVLLDGLEPGLYLVSAVHMVQNDWDYFFDSTLIALPGLGESGLWQYQVSVTLKSEMLPPVHPNETLEFQVLKLWKDNGSQTGRPQSIEVEIFRDGVSAETVTLSEETNWTYRWSAKKDGAVWMVVERNIPAEYTVTVEKQATTFILTNTLLPEKPPAEEPPAEEPPSGDVPPADSPNTGDTPHILLYTILMYASGIALILLGITGKRKRV